LLKSSNADQSQSVNSVERGSMDAETILAGELATVTEAIIQHKLAGGQAAKEEDQEICK
jgi:hypothetical protein